MPDPADSKGPWERYSEPESGPWSKYVQPEPSTPAKEKRGFLSSFADQLNPFPALKEWWNRPAEINRARQTFHVYVQAGKRNPENAGLPIAKWKNVKMTPEEQAIYDEGMDTNLGGAAGYGPDMLHLAGAPGVKAAGQAVEGDVSGAAGTLAGGYGMPIAVPAAIRRIPAGWAAGKVVAGKAVPDSVKSVASEAAAAYRAARKPAAPPADFSANVIEMPRAGAIPPTSPTPPAPPTPPTPASPKRAPNAARDDFYEPQARMDKVFRAADELHRKGITAKQLEALTPSERAKALGREHSDTTFQHLLFRLRGLETGKASRITPEP